MIIIAIVRISGLRMETTVLDVVWELFWQQAEAAVAVIMVSITAFRSLLGIKANGAREKTQRSWTFSQHRPNLQAGYFKKTKTATTHDESELERLPDIPGANFTGMRTFICGESMLNESSRGGGTGVGVHKSENKDLVGAHNHEPHEIKVIHQFSIESEILNRPGPAKATNFVWIARGKRISDRDIGVFKESWILGEKTRDDGDLISSILLAITNLRDLIARYARCAVRLLVVSSDPYLCWFFRNKLGNPL